MSDQPTAVYGERFTHRLEAFGDLVFGFSLSLLATRLDIPAHDTEIFDPTRWLTFAVTFGMICSIWLAHYRIFRHRFIAGPFDVVLNFVFLFGIAVLPYAVQTFLRFGSSHYSLALYLGDFSLVVFALATLRLRALHQRRNDSDLEVRLREWRGTLRQYAIVAIIASFLAGVGNQIIASERLFSILPLTIVAIAGIVRFAVRRLPFFLRADL